MLTYLIRVFLALSTGSATGWAAGVVAPPHESTPTTSAATVDATDSMVDRTQSPRVAQVRLVETLASADAIHGIRARGNTVTFTVSRGDRTLAIVATIGRGGRGQARRGDVIGFEITAAPVADLDTLGGGLSWLSDELDGATAITRLVPDDDGAVTVFTDDGRRYMVIPGRGSGGAAAESPGNQAVSARWAAAWDRD